VIIAAVAVLVFGVAGPAAGAEWCPIHHTNHVH
jgi:hypothetical protein